MGRLTSLRLLSLGEYTGYERGCVREDYVDFSPPYSTQLMFICFCSGNAFSLGPMPSCLSTLTNLEALFMANCNLNGPLPLWIEQLSELRQLDLQRNGLQGRIPTSVGKLQNLLYLNLKDNPYLNGELPLREIVKLTKLNRLSLVHCQFTNAELAMEELQTQLPRCRVWI